MPIPTRSSSVWHLWVDLGRTTIGIFDTAEKGLDFIRSFGLSEKIYSNYGDRYTYSNTSYNIDFTAEEANECGFLDKSFWESVKNARMTYMLFLDEVQLNKLVVSTISYEDE